MFAVLGEHKSDAATLKVFVRRLVQSEASVKTKGYSGCGELLRKGAQQVRVFQQLGAKYFIIVHDADGPDSNPAYQRVLSKIVQPAKVNSHSCILIPVQELEAWIMADETAVSAVIPTFKLKAHSSQELIANPKECLERLSRQGRTRPLYSHAVHNERVAKHICIAKLSEKCPSFRPLQAFIAEIQGEGAPSNTPTCPR